MTLEERIAQGEIAVGRHSESLSHLATILDGLTNAVSGMTRRLGRIEARLTNIETDLVIVKGWLAPPSENGSEA